MLEHRARFASPDRHEEADNEADAQGGDKTANEAKEPDGDSDDEDDKKMDVDVHAGFDCEVNDIKLQSRELRKEYARAPPLR